MIDRHVFRSSIRIAVALAMMGVLACQPQNASNQQPASGRKSESAADDDFAARDRQRMVEEQLRGRDITNERVLAAMERVPRHLFVPERLRDAAYDDHPLPIGDGQTISQPYIVALMTQLAKPEPNAKVLDIGTGSGYQAAVLAEVCEHVYSIEIIEALASEARDRLEKLGYQNVTVRHGDGYQGWAEHAPFNAIIVAAAPDHIPQPLIEQLAPNGRLVIPIGNREQELLIVEKSATGEIHKRTIAPVAFVPMTGEARKK
jgi:protein-L-isoaspartate(D-aspartate) O-methyltransferase